MHPIPSSYERSLQRSALRRRVFICLASLGEAYLSQLSRHTGIRSGRVKAVLVGALPSYRPERSLVALGLAREVQRGEGSVYEITPRGRRKARSLVQWMGREARVDEFRRSLRGARPVDPHRAAPREAGEGPPGPDRPDTASFTWRP